MKKTLLLLLLALSGSFSFGQVMPNPAILYQKTAIVKLKQPLIVIGHLNTNYNSLIMDPDNLRIIKTYSDSLELLSFKDNGKDGVILAELKVKTPLLKLDEILDYYKVAPDKRTLKVLVDNRPVNPGLFLADVKKIKRIEVTKQDAASPVRYSWDKDEEFLNIVTIGD